MVVLVPEDAVMSESILDRASSVLWWDVVERNCIRVRGADAGSYLHSQLSNDIAGLEPLNSCQSFVLEPTGKINALVRVTRGPQTIDGSESSRSTSDGESFLIDSDAEGEEFAQLVQRLQRFKIRVKADFSLGKITMISLRWGDQAGNGLAGNETVRWTLQELQSSLTEIDPILVSDAWWGDGRAFDLLISPFAEDGSYSSDDGSSLLDRSRAIASLVIDSLASQGVECQRAESGELDVLRVSTGWPAMGSEIRPGETIPAATGIVRRVASFTKGCYPGQELVERMDSRGSTAPQSLRVISGDVLGGLGPGDAITVDGATVGTVTSVAKDVALAYVSRSVELGMVVGGT